MDVNNEVSARMKEFLDKRIQAKHGRLPANDDYIFCEDKGWVLA